MPHISRVSLLRVSLTPVNLTRVNLTRVRRTLIIITTAVAESAPELRSESGWVPRRSAQLWALGRIWLSIRLRSRPSLLRGTRLSLSAELLVSAIPGLFRLLSWRHRLSAGGEGWRATPTPVRRRVVGLGLTMQFSVLTYRAIRAARWGDE